MLHSSVVGYIKMLTIYKFISSTWFFMYSILWLISVAITFKVLRLLSLLALCCCKENNLTISNFGKKGYITPYRLDSIIDGSRIWTQSESGTQPVRIWSRDYGKIMFTSLFSKAFVVCCLMQLIAICLKVASFWVSSMFSQQLLIKNMSHQHAQDRLMEEVFHLCFLFSRWQV